MLRQFGVHGRVVHALLPFAHWERLLVETPADRARLQVERGEIGILVDARLLVAHRRRRARYMRHFSADDRLAPVPELVGAPHQLRRRTSCPQRIFSAEGL